MRGLAPSPPHLSYRIIVLFKINILIGAKVFGYGHTIEIATHFAIIHRYQVEQQQQQQKQEQCRQQAHPDQKNFLLSVVRAK